MSGGWRASAGRAFLRARRLPSSNDRTRIAPRRFRVFFHAFPTRRRRLVREFFDRFVSQFVARVTMNVGAPPSVRE
jgi:hypothetical protein